MTISTIRTHEPRDWFEYYEDFIYLQWYIGIGAVTERTNRTASIGVLNFESYNAGVNSIRLK